MFKGIVGPRDDICSVLGLRIHAADGRTCLTCFRIQKIAGDCGCADVKGGHVSGKRIGTDMKNMIRHDGCIQFPGFTFMSAKPLFELRTDEGRDGGIRLKMFCLEARAHRNAFRKPCPVRNTLPCRTWPDGNTHIAKKRIDCRFRTFFNKGFRQDLRIVSIKSGIRCINDHAVLGFFLTCKDIPSSLDQNPAFTALSESAAGGVDDHAIPAKRLQKCFIGL